MRGGSKHTAAMQPIDRPSGRNVLTELDSVQKCNDYIQGGIASCYKRLKIYMNANRPPDYGGNDRVAV
eukprot:3238739-Pleurochrysis_carterae.AAC.1